MGDSTASPPRRKRTSKPKTPRRREPRAIKPASPPAPTPTYPKCAACTAEAKGDLIAPTPEGPKLVCSLACEERVWTAAHPPLAAQLAAEGHIGGWTTRDSRAARHLGFLQDAYDAVGVPPDLEPWEWVLAQYWPLTCSTGWDYLTWRHTVGIGLQPNGRAPTRTAQHTLTLFCQDCDGCWRADMAQEGRCNRQQGYDAAGVLDLLTMIYARLNGHDDIPWTR